MTDKEFIYAAFCNFRDKGKKKAQEYVDAHPKAEYNCDDWVAVFYSEPDPIKTGGSRPLMNPMPNNGTHCFTTKQWP